MQENEDQRTFNKQSPQNINNGLSRAQQINQNPVQNNKVQDEQEQIGLLDQFKQQMMKAWQPVPTLTKTIIMFFIMSAIFLSIGIPMIILSKNLSQSSMRYDTLQTTTCPINSTCSVTFAVQQTLKAPVFVYYQINNFYQNHRLYAPSFSFDQQNGYAITTVEAEDSCTPIVYNRDVYIKTSAFNSSILLNPNDIANPCGIIALTVFNDTYNLLYQNGTQITILNTGIAWPSDVSRYKASNPNEMWYNTLDQRFMNWMRIAAMSDFRKLWGRIQTDVPAGNYTLVIKNQYDLSKVNGQKYFVLSTANFFGSKSNFLAISYISVGSVCLLMGFLFLMRKLSKKRKII